MTAQTEVAVLEIRSTSEGLAEAKQKIAELGEVTIKTESAIIGYGASLEKVAASIDPVVRANDLLERQQRRIQAAYDKSIATGMDMDKANRLMISTLEAAVTAHDKTIARLNETNNAHANTNIRMQEAMHSTRGFVEMVMAGQDPLRAFSMEAVRAGSVLTQMDSGFRQSAMSILAVGAPLLALGVIVGTVAEHMMTLNAENRKLQAGGITFNNQNLAASSYQDLSHIMAASGSFSRADTLAATQTLQQYRTFDASMTQAIGTATVPFAEATGQTAQAAAKQLADAMKSGYDGIMKLNEAYGFLSPAQAKHILDLSLEGKSTEAARTALEDFRAQMEKAAEAGRSGGESASMTFGNAWTLALDSIVNSSGFQKFEKAMAAWAIQAALGVKMATAPESPLDAAASRLAQADKFNKKAHDPNAHLSDSQIAIYQREFDAAQTEFDRLRDAEIHANEEREKKIAAAGVKAAKETNDQITNTKIEAAQKVQALYFGRLGMPGSVAVSGSYGAAHDRLALQQEHAKALLDAGDDPVKQAQADADYKGKSAELGARLATQTNQSIRDLGLQLTAQERLTAAVGDFNAVTEAQIANYIEKQRVTNPGMTTGQEEKIADAMRATANSQRSQATNQFIHDMEMQTAAQDRLTEAVGDYNATVAATIENEISRQRYLNPNMTDAQDKKIREDMQAQADAKQAAASENALLDLQNKVKAKQDEVKQAMDLGMSRSKGLMSVDALQDQWTRTGVLPEDQAKMRDLIPLYNKAMTDTATATYARSISPTAGLDQSQRQLEALIASENKYGATEEDITKAILDNNIRRLQATESWVDGAQAAFLKYQQSAENLNTAMGQVVTSGMKSVEDALMSVSGATKKPIDAFRQMASSIIAEFERMMVIRPMLAQLAGAMSGMSPGSASGGASGGMGMMGMGGGLLGGLTSGISNWFTPGSNTVDLSQLVATPGVDYAAALSQPATSGASDFFSSMFSSIFHEGGVVGQGGMSRLTDPGLFLGAPRFHSGGLVGDIGLAPNEVPAILQQGEEVLTANDPRHIANSPIPGTSIGHTINLGINVDARGSKDSGVTEAKIRKQFDEALAQHAPALIAAASNHALTTHANLMQRGGRYARATRGQ